ncbi:MAG: chitobiase/beta-hexosaminidase C-terminal domain-containing protein [Candidatus Cloacimonetes bacterium]|nr:chitobiase/beta-hexosaminidase C-terminal domain-containing protein [Candidatus Cloacimonadota bacterium]
MIRKKAIFIFMITLGVLLSCTIEFRYDNIFDPESSIDPSLWKPSNLELNLVNNTSIRLSWEKSSWMVDGYRISRKTDNDAWQDNYNTVDDTILEWTDTNAMIGQHYYYQVRAFAGDNVSEAIEQDYHFALSAPANLILTLQISTSVKLSWQDTNQFEEGYQISRKTGNDLWQEDFAIVSANVQEWTDISITQNQFFEYKVRAFWQNHYSNDSMIIGYHPKVETPVFSLQSGTYSAVQTVNISCSTIDAVIRYTTDGSEPDSLSQMYSSGIRIDETMILKAKAFKSGFQDSNTASAQYIVNLPAISLLFPAGGETLHKGSTYTINWITHSSNIQNVSILLYKGESLWQAVNNSTANTGSYQWTVFWQIQTGDDYSIKIRNADIIGYPNEYDVSGYFSIVP